LLVVLGGDGTMLNAARALAGSGVPLVGINAGRLGFLTDLSAAEIPAHLDRILDGDYREERRALLRMQLGKTQCLAMNDVVVQKRDGRMIEFETWVNGSFVCAHRADGIVIATPTGSTAYALSSGGPILNPGLDALVMVPICPHTLTDRPLVIDGNSRVEIVLGADRGMQAQVSCDGQSEVSVPDSERIVIQRADEYTVLLHPTGYDYFKTLRSKLHWGRDKEQDIGR
ncbi:MAG TPA: NAD(+)/NADH kinase, partial [Gammaproteobacteria bacterium]|nr:NAD(+)/NADH kinase [Gammaproteobacteria bacterium]